MNDSLAKQVLVTGGTGFVGKTLVRMLLARGYAVTVLARSSPKQPIAGAEYITGGDLLNVEGWFANIQQIDIFIHLAARVHQMDEAAEKLPQKYMKENRDATEKLAEMAAAKGAKRFIYLSSVKAVGDGIEGHSYTEEDEPMPVDDYGKSKLAAEEALKTVSQKTGMEFVIIRPPLVYGDGVGGNFMRLTEAVKNRVPLPFGLIKNNRRSFVWVNNLCNFICHAAIHPAAAGELFFVSDGDDISTLELVKRIGRQTSCHPFIVPLPLFLLRFLLRLVGKEEAGKRLMESLTVDISKSERLLGWQPKLKTGNRLE